MVHAFYVYLSCFMTRHAVVWELVELSADVVLPLHSLKKRGAT